MINFYKDKQQIINWLNKYEVKNYTLILDEKYKFVVDVIGDVNLRDKDFTNIPVKFNEIKGGFSCHKNNLTSLEFCPQTVSGSFWCNNNQLKSLEFCPQKINGNFWCHKNNLSSLKFSPQTVGGSFGCSENQLTSLEFSPQQVGSDFYCGDNKLILLEFCPETVGGSFYCDNNPKLQEIQKISDFNLIYLEHKKISTKKLAEKLNNDLQFDSSKKMTRIKI